MDIISKSYAPNLTNPQQHEWQDDAACVEFLDDRIFFPRRGEGYAKAKEICKSCLVREDCLNYTLEVEADSYDIEGMFGGLTPDERRELRGFERRDKRKAKDG